MRQYLLKRLLLIPPTLFGILLISFFITRFVPGGPLEQALEEKRAAAERRGGRVGGAGGAGSSLSEEETDRLKELYGFNRPATPAFFEWLGAKPRELSPKSYATFAPGETGEKPVRLVLPVYLKLAETKPRELVPFEFDAVVTLDKDARPSLKLPEDLKERIGTWAKQQNGGAAEAEKKAMAGAFDWKVATVAKDYDKPTGLTWVKSLFVANDEPTDPGKPKRIRIFRTGFSGVIQGDFGDSFIHSRPVIEVIGSKMQVSVIFGLASMFFSYAISIPLGVLKARKHGTFVDSATSFVMFFFYAVPGFVLATLLLKMFGFMVHWFPHSGFRSENFATMTGWEYFRDVTWHMTLPLIAMTIGQLAFMCMLMKNSLMDNLGSDYVRTAVAKGVPFGVAVTRHAFRNSLVPLATSFGSNLGVIFTGSFLIERIFDIDGFGKLSFTSLVGRDYPVFMANLLFGAILLLIGNILSDICVALVDPRIRFDK